MQNPRLGNICVVGASLAGLRAVQALRKHGYPGGITLVGAETVLPYDRPPLSKQVLTGQWDVERIALIDDAAMEALDVDLRLGVEATALDLERRVVTLSSGEPINFDGLIVATGAHPRMLPIRTPQAGVMNLRTLDDSIRLRSSIAKSGTRVVVVGGGFIGLEVASSCHASGAEVTVVEMLQQPLEQVLGSEIGERCATWHRGHGIDIRCGVSVQSFVGTAVIEGVELSDGTIIPADVVVVGVGVEPSTAWLVGSGLTIDRGVVCDAKCFAAPDVVAVGDVARWHHDGYGESVRVEHWTNAVEQAEAAALNLLAGAQAAHAFTPTPYFWSDQAGKRLQFAGRRGASAPIVLERRGSLDEFVGLFCDGEQLTGAFALGSARAFVGLRRLVNDGATRAAALQSIEADHTSAAPLVSTRKQPLLDQNLSV